MSTVDVAPALLEWAVQRGSTPLAALRRKFPRFDAWREGPARLTLRQLEEFASTTNTPVGFLLLEEPPDEPLPVADFRVRDPDDRGQPSANLLDQIYLCEQRQAWYREYAQDLGLPRVHVVGSADVDVPAANAAGSIRRDLGLPTVFGATQRSWSEALSSLAERVEALGVLVMISGVVASNTSRRLDEHEFSGFALSDPHAPVIFINGNDTKASQVFTLAHEVAHIYLGDSALSFVDPGNPRAPEREEWCNAVAASLLVDAEEFLARTRRPLTYPDDLDRLAEVFKVSTLVVLRRLHELGRIESETFFAEYRRERQRLAGFHREHSEGGQFYNTAPVRASKRFVRAIVQSTLEGRTLYTEAFALVGTHKSAAIHELARRLGA